MILGFKEYQEYRKFMNIDNEEEEFLNYLKRRDVQERLSGIDEELGTNYIDTVNDFLDKKAYYIIPTDAVIWGETIPYPKDKICDIFINIEDCPKETLEHELRHAFESTNVFNKYLTGQYPFGYEIAIKESPRLKKIVEDNIVDYDTFKRRFKTRFGNIEEKSIQDRYKYYSTPTEVSSFMHPVV